MKSIPFTKMHGCGNDFILIDNREDIMEGVTITKFAAEVCKRRFHIGADGLMLLEKSTIATFKMRYFNADGSEGEMCGNGARCLCKFAFQLGVTGKEMTFETLNGIYEASIHDSYVKVKFPELKKNEIVLNQVLSLNNQNKTYHYANVGVPHTVWLQDSFDLSEWSSFYEWGRMIRNRTDIFPQGTNVNLIEILDRHHINIRTYERGVEEETLACGSGATASAIMSRLLDLIESPVTVKTLGGTLRVSFQVTDEMIQDIYLEGNAVTVCEGTIPLDDWKGVKV
ncbi:diaminopimelate epimerase [Bacillus sp. FJAT-29937]|uniref:diaminopimelate epimerase n=1 Tax=Bacillus sp. FJAT-29937 TaxID=1720553 RepID=UPI0009E6D967|nr:diaminopimelate epimerase [Bacillus sp. FJAT-29937]